MRRLVVLVVLVGLGLPGARVAHAQPEVPAFDAPVVDAAGVVPAAVERDVDAELRAYRRRSGHEVAVAIVATTGARSLEDYSIHLARSWGVGDEGRADGVLLLIVVQDRRVRIEVGTGMVGTLTDADARRIIDHDLVPSLRAGDFATAVEAGTSAIRRAEAEPSDGFPTIIFLVGGLAALTMFIAHWSAKQRRDWGIRHDAYWSGVHGGGGFGGGGGGGGGFGGGGASGGW